MTITITDYEDEVFAIHQVDQQTAAYLGHLLEPHSFPAPVPETQPEEADAQVVLDDILTACRNEIPRVPPARVQRVDGTERGFQRRAGPARAAVASGAGRGAAARSALRRLASPRGVSR